MRIVFAIPSLFPFGTPYSSRALNLARLLMLSGHEVIVFCDYLSNEEFVKRNGIAEYEGIEIHYLTIARTIMDKLTVEYRTPQNVDRYVSENKTDLLFTSSVSNRIERLIRVGQKHHLPVLLESCEKFHPSNWKYGKYDFRYIRFKHCWNHVYIKADGVIAISRYLTQHFQSHGVKAIRIPTILDVENRAFCDEREDEDSIVRFVFAGSLGGGKDRVAEFIQAMYTLPEELCERIQFNIYGPNMESIESQLGDRYGILEKMENVIIHGRVSQQEIPQILMNNDFGIILRPNRESSEAGFSTKLAECMEVGTSVFANATGDIELYVKDGYNGVLLQSESVDAIRQKLMDVLKLSRKDLNNMRLNARKTAIASFDYRKYQKQISALLDEIARKKE